ncbi:hypothetical protein HWV62_39403 [Athelia sp. TMB]|nr:hypothetical protein HWV62_39403 [Athelia sp. TMB]
MASSADASAKVTCDITNIRAVNLPRHHPSRSNKAWVQIEAADPHHTPKETWKNGGEVRWKETTALQALAASESITFSLMRDRAFPKASKILEGSLKIKLSDLLERCDDGKETCKLRMQITIHIPNAPSSSTAAPPSSISAPFSSTSASSSSVTAMPSPSSICATPGPTAAALSSAMDSLPKITTSLSKSGPVTTGADALSSTGDAVASVAHSDLVTSLETVVGKLDILVKIGDEIAKIHPWASLAWNVLSIGLKLVKDNHERNNKMAGLIETLQSTYAIVDGARVVKDDRLQDVLGRIFQQTVDCAYFIQHYARSRSSLGKAITEPFSDTDARIDEYQKQFAQFQMEFNGHITVKTALLTVGISATVDAIRLDQLKDKLGRVKMDQTERDACLLGTRVDAINLIMKWYSDDSPGRKNTMWLHGMAGAGKSTLSTTIAKMMRHVHLLGAFFFFDRSVAERKPSTLISTIAYQLAEFDAVIGARIQQVIEKIPGIASEDFNTQFSKLLSSEALGDIPWSRGPILIIIDALDESGTAAERRRLLKVLSEGVSKLPDFIRLLIVSRRERDIEDCLENDIVRREELGVDPKTNKADIAVFIRSCLDQVRNQKSNKEYFSDALEVWPGDDDINSLVNWASGHFIWAHTACRMVDTDGNPKDDLKDLIRHLAASDSSFPSLYQLYHTALTPAIQWNNPQSCARARDLLGAVTCAQVPLSYVAIDELLDQRSPSLKMVKSLGSVLSWSETGPIRILHTSFYEYLTLHSTTGPTAGPWALTVSEFHAKLAKGCIALLTGKMKENMCNLVLPHPITDETLPEATAYAANFWVEHVCLIVKPAEDLADTIHQFMCDHLLHWMEALSIGKAFDVALRSLPELLKWIQEHFPGSELFDFVKDAHRFARYFEHTIIEHPLLVYTSAVPFTPRNTLIYKNFHRGGLPRVAAGVEPEWPPLLQILRDHESTVQCVCFSRDGSKIVSGSYDRTVRVRDALSGQPALPPLQHEGGVRSVCFSPDGSRIVSGSDDGTIQVWDALSGQLALPPLQGHEDIVMSVCFSPDGSRIVSGSSDMTVRVWDVSGQPTLSPLRGHAGRVTSVCFSPDGSRIVSGSDDRTVRVWDALSGQLALPPLQGHKSIVHSVCFSPDGSRIVSGSDDTTVRVWDALSGQPTLSPLRGHAGRVTSVCFSPDGSRIVSGSSDKTVRVWDGLSGQPALPPLQGHEGAVISVCFSPDGSRIVSGSDDTTVRVWDALSGQPALPPLQGHKATVNSVCFSPDGSRIVSGSSDKTVRVWDALSGQPALPPLQGHEVAVHSVCFSPDGSRIVSRSWDNTTCVWDACTGHPTEDQTNYIEPPSGATDHTGQILVRLDKDDYFYDVSSRRYLAKIPSGFSFGNSWGTEKECIP